MITQIILYLFALADMVLFYIFYQEWVSWIVLVAVLGLPWLSLAVSLPAIFTTRLELDVPARTRLHAPLRLQFRGKCTLPVPPIKAKFCVTRPMTGERWVLKPGDKLPTNHCGSLLIQPRHLRLTDYLGLIPLPPKPLAPVTVTVLPAPEAIPLPPDLDRYLAKSWRPKSGGGFSENHELRPYRPGDNLNQVHWKLTAKTGSLTIREPMIPERGLVLLTMDLSGTPDMLDRKFGQLLWLGTYLLEQAVTFEIRAMTDQGLERCPVCSDVQLQKALELLLCRGTTQETILDHPAAASWQYHIGGDSHVHEA